MQYMLFHQQLPLKHLYVLDLKRKGKVSIGPRSFYILPIINWMIPLFQVK